MTAAQYDRLKSEQQWILSSEPATQPASHWSESVAQQIAAQSGIQLSEGHWEVIRYVRHYYLERGCFLEPRPKQ
jgi:sulfur relay (sulfurtransferase) DsrC/TusE family protein